MSNARRTTARLNGHIKSGNRDAARLLRMADRHFEAEGGSLVPASWRPKNVREWLAGPREPVLPEFGARDDGVFLLYPGKTHSIVAETESGKTWLLLLWCAQLIMLGLDVVYIDFEDSMDGIMERLLLLVSDEDLIADHFEYICPEEMLDGGNALADSAKTATLVVVDGVTEAMTLVPLDASSNDWNARFAEFNGKLVVPFTRNGAAVAVADHPPKDDGKSKTPKRFASGAGHKIRGLSGASYVVVNREEFGRGLRGRSEVYVAKDRPAYVRQYGVEDEKAGMRRIADLIVDSTGDGTEVSLTPPGEDAFRPTTLMGKLSRAAKEMNDELSKQAMEENGRVSDKDREFTRTKLANSVTGSREQYKYLAMDVLIGEGYLFQRLEQHGQQEWKYLKFIKLFSGRDELDPSI